jgi:hypothetical protein
MLKVAIFSKVSLSAYLLVPRCRSTLLVAVSFTGPISSVVVVPIG